MDKSLISAMFAAKIGQLQLVVAARLAKTDPQSGASVSQLRRRAAEFRAASERFYGAGSERRYQLLTPFSPPLIAAPTNFTPSALAHSAGPAISPISQPDRSTISVVGMPNALPAALRS